MRGLSAKCREMRFSRNYFVEEKPVDQVHGSVDRAGPVHHGPAAIAACGSSPELGLRPLRCLRDPTKGRGGAVGGADAGHPFIGSEGERGGRASERNGR
jgi:hypothetical protein